MASKKLFASKSSKSNSVKVTKVANTVNEAGGIAYKREDKAALAQLCITGCFNNTYYVSDKDQLDKVIDLANKVEPEFVAKLATYAHKYGAMKDSPAVLCAVLASKGSDYLPKVFGQVIDNPKMLRNFVQVMRSGVAGRKSLGSRSKRLVQNYLESMSDEQLFRANVGNDPSLKDIIKLCHPKPGDKSRQALYAYLLDKEYNKEDLCKLVSQFEVFKKDMGTEIPNVPFQMLTALPLTNEHWTSIADNATWTQVRMNLNTFARHDVLKDANLVKKLATKLADKEQVRKANAFPYQLFTAWQNITSDVPMQLGVALQDAAEHAVQNVPDFGGKKVVVLVDVSGSMSSPITGTRGTTTTKTRCIDAAALFACAVLRKNVDAVVIPFDTRIHDVRLNPRDSMVTNAKLLASFGGGGTNCSAAIQYLNVKNISADLVVMISDNESWCDNNRYGATETMNQWNKFKVKNKEARLACIDITPSSSTQAHNRTDILNLGGFSDTLFEVVNKFAQNGNDGDLWIKVIESVEL
jgi:60 kDa SS-A/Ro ribonucleoprotein